MYTPAETQKYFVEYHPYNGGRKQSFDLFLDYLQGTMIAIHLFAEEKPSGTWEVLSASIDENETSAEPSRALEDLAKLQWLILPAKERRRKIPCAIALWEKGQLVIAACLPDQCGQERLSAKVQMNGKTSAARRLCWWPDSVGWDEVKEAVSQLRLIPPEGLPVPFFPFSEWIRLPETVQHTKKLLAMVGKGELQTLRAEIYGDLYAEYLRNTKTVLLYLKQRKIPATLVLGETAKKIPEFLAEEIPQQGSLGIAGERRAVLSHHSIWPDGNTKLDMIGAAIYAGGTHMIDLLAWPNPLIKGSEEKAQEVLMKEIVINRGVQKIAIPTKIQPFKVCPNSHRLLLAPLPDEKDEGWQQ